MTITLFLTQKSEFSTKEPDFAKKKPGSAKKNRKELFSKKIFKENVKLKEIHEEAKKDESSLSKFDECTFQIGKTFAGKTDFLDSQNGVESITLSANTTVMDMLKCSNAPSSSSEEDDTIHSPSSKKDDTTDSSSSEKTKPIHCVLNIIY